MSWQPTVTWDRGGYHRIIATPPGRRPMDITFVRGAQVDLGEYTDTDPFGDATCPIGLPMCTVADDPTSDELAFLADDTLIDIWWIPAMPVPAGWDPTVGGRDTALWVNPLSERKDIVCPAFVYEKHAGLWRRTSVRRGDKVWEGHVASLEITGGDKSDALSLSCQGALLQADLTSAKPFFPPRPQTVESLILRAFDKNRDPTLKTSHPRIQWPDAWTRVAPDFDGTDSVFVPNVKPGKRWTGYTSRNTGSWDHYLTGFVQNLLAIMVVRPGSGIPAGSQWTLLNALEGDPDFPAGRTPVLRVRDRYGAETFSMWVRQPGLTLNLTRDSTQSERAVYGTGTDFAGTTWRNSQISPDGSRTDYRPLAWDRTAWPATDNPALNTDRFLRETYIQYGSGISQVDATESAALTLERNRDPGFSGTITLSVDPSPDLSRWAIRAGMSIRLKGFMGSGSTGRRFHIAQAAKNPKAGTVTLTVDTRYRDLVTLNEAITRTRDALTPARLLTLNRNSVTIEDIQAPWDYSAGSGFIPKPSRRMYAHMPQTELFPYQDWVAAHPPRKHKDWYVECHAGARNSQRRWAGPIQVLMGEKGTIRRTEVFCVDEDGHLVLDKFHVSFWYFSNVNAAAMPNDGKTWSPFIFGAFEELDPRTGQPWSDNPNLAPKSGLVNGYGNYKQPSGYSPGLKTEGAQPSGLLIDEGGFTWDCSTNNNNYRRLAAAGTQDPQAISVYAMFYSEHGSTVYFGGRLFRQEPGTES